jgi:UDP-N-acetylglucosamine--N-acetylmuramyl-(pentapeptide) pyrophosphoryl-undecaprenol N-acetylglucosamine transferase
MKILAAGGGSGGHVTPVLAVINQLSALEPNLEVTFVCDVAFEEQSRGLMAHAAVPVAVRTISAGKFRRYSHLTFWQHFTVPSVVWGNLRDLSRIIAGFFESFGLLIAHRPDVVFAKGGYVCLPLGIAAWLLRVPLVIHDSDTRPGLTNRILSRFAKVIATGSPLDNYPYDSRKSHYTGVPIAEGFRPVSDDEQSKLKKKLGFNANEKLIVATGGGLGAAWINQGMVRVAPQLAKAHISIYDIAGKKNYDMVADVESEYSNFKAVPFVFENMHEVLGAADVVVARGSATFMQELAGLRKAVVMIPARSLGDQLKNAKVYKAADAAEIVDDSETLGENDSFADLLLHLCSDAERREVLARNLYRFARPNAAQDLAKLIISAIR